MKTKVILSLALVFSMLFAFCGCKKLESSDGYEVTEEYYVTDAEGVTFEIETEVNEEGETEYFYTDNSGNVVEVESKAVKKEKKTVKVTTTGANGETEEISYTPEQQSFIDAMTDPDKMDELVEDVTIEFEAGDELVVDQEQLDDIKESAAQETTTSKGSSSSSSSGATTEATTTSGRVTDFYESISNKDKVTIEMNMKVVTDDEATEMPVVMAKDGSNLYLEASLPVSDEGVLKSNLIIKDKKCTLYVPSMKAYIDVPSDSVDELMENFDVATEQDGDMKYLASGTVTHSGTKYDIDIYESDDGATVTYYYLGSELKRIESKYDESNYSIIEYTKVSDTVDQKLFVAPSGYFNMTDIIDAN